MTARPDAVALLEIARATFRDAISPHVPKERRFEAAMVANAMAIATRDAAERAGADAAWLERLTSFYGDDAPRQAGCDAETQRVRLTRRLAREIRDGALDRVLEGRLRRILRARTLNALRISNPKRYAVTEAK